MQLFRGTSLNSELLQGPHLTSSLFGVFTRFRVEPVAVMTDIQAICQSSQSAKSDVDFLRFLWWPNGDVGKPPVEHCMLVYVFRAVSSPSCANFALRQTARDNKSAFAGSSRAGQGAYICVSKGRILSDQMDDLFRHKFQRRTEPMRSGNWI